MDSVDDTVRELVAKELHEIKPIYASGVETAEAMGSYDQNFYAKSIKQMQSYQRSHRRIFCKSCIEPDDVKGRLIYRRLCVELNDDLLGNDQKHIQMRCFKCGFDMFVKATPELMITERISEGDWNQMRSAMVAACDAGIPPEQLHRELMQASQRYSMEQQRMDMRGHRMQQGSFGQAAHGGLAGPGQAQSGPMTATELQARSAQGMDQLDAMRYMMQNRPELIDPQKYLSEVEKHLNYKPGSLSSAPTVPAGPPPKKKK